jgi:uncharacterized SAM-binding protein YcdF (DUF218 family)
MDFFNAKQILKNLVLPPTGPLILAILGLGVLHFTRWRRSGTALCAAALLALWILATPIVADMLVRAGERYPSLDLHQVPHADAIVILANGVRLVAAEYDGPAPSLTTLQRLAYGALVARATRLPILVSGTGQEAAAMRNSLQRDFGVQVQWVESHSRDTQQNAQMAAVILKGANIATIVLVTSANHMNRAAAEFRALGLTVIPAPTGMWTQQEWHLRRWVPSADALGRSQSALYEDLGDVVQAFRVH